MQTDQVPSSSSNIALPSTQHTPSYGARPPTTGDPRRDNAPVSMNAPPNVPEKERKARRTHRDKVLAQQYAQDSGLSSSEQEQARDRLKVRVAVLMIGGALNVMHPITAR